MKSNDFYKNPKFWLLISVIYLVFLFCIIWIYNPDFLIIKNCLLFLPLYAPLVIASNLQHKNDVDDSDNRWTIKFYLIGVSLIIVIFKIIVGYLK